MEATARLLAYCALIVAVVFATAVIARGTGFTGVEPTLLATATP